MWYNLDSYRFMLLVNMYFGNKESISLDVDFLYKVSSICFFMFYLNGITFLNPTAVEFHHPLLDHVCFKLLYDQNFKIISYFDFQKWILI